MECSQEYYIHNFKLKSSAEFDESLINSGTSIYEVIRIEQGIPLFLEDHLSRLYDSAELSHLNINESYCDFETLITELVKKNNVSQGKIKLVIRFNNGSESQEKDVLIYFTPHYFPSYEEYTNGVKVGLCRTVRPNPNAKILNTEARKKANHAIVEEKLFEVLLMNEKGFITEGSRSNIFFIKDDQIITPPQKEVLNGITRRNMLKICKQNKIDVLEKSVHISDTKDMDSVFLSGTSLKVLPVKQIGTHEFKIDNSVLQKVMKLYDDAIGSYILSKKKS